MNRIAFAVFFAASLACSAQAANYVPPKGAAWATRTPAQEGFDVARLKAAVDFVLANEVAVAPELARVIDPRDLSITIPLQFAKEPFSGPIGPLKPRSGPSVIVMRHGYIVAEAGDTHAADLVNSVTKTFLSSVAGVAFDRHMIRDVNDRVLDYVHPSPDFELAHNQPITWDQMLRQTSGWEGTMWGKPWWADRPGKEPWSDLAAGPPVPGEKWEYNDVRVNALSLALTHLWKRPLPDVLRETVMDPIGASDTWQWYGYDNSWIELDGKRIQAVPGGGHWGGGLYISARDMARMGLLASRKGKWGGKRILSDKWIAMARTPTRPNPGYGYMNWFLNTDKKLLPAAREDSVAFLGNGTNMVFIDYEHDIVAVVRWIDDEKKDEFVAMLEGALTH